MGDEYQTILEKRAKLLAKTKTENERKEAGLLLVFKLGEEEQYAINYDDIKRVVSDYEITTIPSAPSNIEGITYHQGDVFSVVNLSTQFELKKSNKSREIKNLILIENEDKKLAFEIDEIIGQESLDENQKIVKISTRSKQREKLFLGIYMGDIAIINTKAIFDAVHDLQGEIQ